MGKSIASVTSQLPEIDPIGESLHYLAVVCFPKSTSPNFAMALSIARSADKFVIGKFGDRPLHVAAFSASADGSAKAIALMGLVASWKGAMTFARGRLVSNRWELEQVLKCILDAGSSRDPRAHCVELIRDPSVPPNLLRNLPVELTFSRSQGAPEPPAGIYAFPCKYLLRHSFRPDPIHPSSIPDQIQAAAVRLGCDFCPYLIPDSYALVKP